MSVGGGGDGGGDGDGGDGDGSGGELEAVERWGEDGGVKNSSTLYILSY